MIRPFVAPVVRQGLSVYPAVLRPRYIRNNFYNLADDVEGQPDRRSLYRRTESSTIPDAKTIWLFRDRPLLKRLGTSFIQPGTAAVAGILSDALRPDH
jgi:hypothetical protein